MKLYIVNYHEYYGLRIDTATIEKETDKLYISKNSIGILDYRKQIKKTEVNNDDIYSTFITDDKKKLLNAIEKIYVNANETLDSKINYYKNKKDCLIVGKKDCEYYVNNILNKGDE